MANFKPRTIMPSIDILHEGRSTPTRYQCDHVSRWDGRCVNESSFVMLVDGVEMQMCNWHRRRIKIKDRVLVSLPSGAPIPRKTRISMIRAYHRQDKREKRCRKDMEE